MGEAPLGAATPGPRRQRSSASAGSKRMAHPGILAAVLLAVLAVPLLALSRGSGSGSKNVAVVQAPKSVLAHDSHATSTSAAGSTTAAPATASGTEAVAPTARIPAAPTTLGHTRTSSAVAPLTTITSTRPRR